jgi:hypothetical protein
VNNIVLSSKQNLNKSYEIQRVSHLKYKIFENSFERKFLNY